jgi:pimeloyl-ACP methyl ester carboxylesterase
MAPLRMLRTLRRASSLLLTLTVGSAAAAAAAAPTTTAAPIASIAPITSFADVDASFAAEARDLEVDGLRLRLFDGGKADGPRVLLLHCFGLSSTVWRAVLPALAAQGAWVVAYDAPGHGQSSKPVRDLTLAQLARTAVAVLDALGWESAHLVGNSMGGGTALFVAIDQPSRVDSLVLVDAVGLDLRVWYRIPWALLDAPLAAGAPDWAWGLVFDQAVYRQSPLVARTRAELLATRRDPLAARATHSFITVVNDILRTDRSAELGRVQAPTLVVTGLHDHLVPPEHATRLQQGIPGARLLAYEDLGHLPEIEDGPRLARDIWSFLQTAPNAPPPPPPPPPAPPPPR